MNPPNPNPTQNTYALLGFNPLPITGGAPQPALDSPAVTWTHGANPQAQSRLLQLPVELRRMILQDLLTADHDISERTQQPGQVPYTYDAAGRARDSRGRFIRPTGAPLAIGHGLTPAILRTCQGLNREGRPELYDRNVLQINFSIGAYQGNLLTQESICSADVPGCQHCAIVTTMDDEIIQQRDHRGIWHYDQNMQRMVDRFGKLLFNFRMAHDEFAYENARRLVSFWAVTSAKEEIQVEVVSPAINAPGTMHTDFLHMFRLMRCAQFSFLQPATLDPVYRGVEREVLSSLPILDLDRARLVAVPMIRVLLTETLRTNNAAMFNQVRACDHQMQRARFEFHPGNFDQAYNWMLNIYRQWASGLEQLAQNNINDVNATVARRAQELARLGRTIQDYQ